MKKRKTDLFRFITLRSPESIAQDKKDLGFVQPAFDFGESHFLSEIIPGDLAGSREGILDMILPFAPIEEVFFLKDTFPEQWDFALWLTKNKDKLVRSELDALVPTSLSGTNIVSLWDNMYYQILTGKNPYIQQACIQMIVANNFISKYATYSPGTTTIPEEIEAERLLLQRLAGAQPLIHQAFTVEKSQSTLEAIDFNLRSKRNLKPQHKAHLANCLTKELEGYLEEFSSLEQQYKADFDAAFKTAESNYKTNHSTTIANYLAANPGATEETLPNDLVPAFEFTYNDPLSTGYSEGKVSNKALTFISENHLEGANFDEVRKKIGRMLNEQLTISSKQLRNRYGKILVNGILTKPSQSAVHDYVISFEKDKHNEAPGDYRMFLTLDAGYLDAYIKSYTITLRIGGQAGTLFSQADCPQPLCNSGGLMFFELLIGSTISFNPCDEIEIDATIEFDSGKTIVIKKVGNSKTLCYTGAAIPQNVLNDAETLYGVNRLGIADYRRVEQELCCYIPGEVSHIENVMAKEYKERISRNLTRSEVLTEVNTEREREDLSDTTSTERHEMSSEVSEVLQKDRSQNFGFNASTSGDLIQNFDLSSYGDFAFSQSLTDSNSEAKTYSEDVTRRALERVVQKTSVRRTSSMVKEYEDTIKHGYDNREGTTNVTGVYRWVDKVFKNKIINYGKRLMYEFMIPEPSRWYKEAIIITAEEEGPTSDALAVTGMTNVAVKPVSLEENGINGAADITRENYQRIAALYGANPEAPMDATKSVTGSFGESPGNGDSEKSYQHDGLMVPANYVCTSVTGKNNFTYKSLVPMYAYTRVSLAGRTFTKNCIEGYGPVAMNLNGTGLNATGNVGISVVTKKVTSYSLSVSLNCELQPEIFQQWQQDTYETIKRAYDEQLSAFNNAQAQQAAMLVAESSEFEDANQTNGRNPRFNTQIMHTELKRLCIEMIAKPHGYQQGKNFYQTVKCDVPELELTHALDKYASEVKFFEQAFDWDLLSKQFFPYYWSDKCDWKSLYQEQDSNDPIFQQFLQSGMGRVVVPVRKGFENAVAFYMETGKIWSGTGLVVDTDDELYVSIANEMQEIEGEVEGIEWETIVPTDLTVIQARSVALDEGGLPCCEAEDFNLDPDTNILTRDTGTTSA
ncbi:MAG: hypothetical protein NXI10_00870 [bacterium]|nr:hypothetical protein [bacterium]